MIRYLLDTHSLLWLVADSPQFSPLARSIVASEDNRLLLVSIASLWEMSIKVSRGKLEIGCPFGEFITRIQEAGVAIWPLETRHLTLLATLPFYHNDPFDRVLATQCLVDQLVLVGRDSLFDAYGVARRW